MTKCKLCAERQTEIDRILKAYKKDKDNFKKEKKNYKIVILVLFGLEILTVAFGKDGILMLFDIVKDKL